MPLRRASRSGVGRLAGGDDHGFPEEGEAAGALELEDLEAAFLEDGGQGGARPELDVAAVPEGGEVA